MTRQRNAEVEEAFTTYKAPGRKCWSAQCKWCQKDMAQHTGRQLSHLRLCQPYQRHLREEGIAPSEARQVSRPVPGPIRSDADSNSPTTSTSSPPPEVRTRAGACGYKIWTGDESVTCPCKISVFAISDGAPGGGGGGEIRCVNCAHRIGNHEDFDAADPEQEFVLLRRKTVQALWSELKLVRAIHICGPPKSGKSTLAGQLAELVSKEGVQVVNVTPIAGRLSLNTNWRTTLKELGLQETFLESRDTRLLVIDCVEKIQKPEFNSFWNEFVTSRELPGLSVALFSAYGIPKGGVQTSPSGPRAIGALDLMGEEGQLIPLRPQQRVSIKAGLDTTNSLVSLYLTREEFDEFVGKYFESEIPRRKMPPAVRDFVWNFTAGHPGCLRALLDALKEKMTRERWSCDDVLEVMEFVYNPVPSGGAFMKFPAIDDLLHRSPQYGKLFDSPDLVEVHQHLASNHNIVATPENRTTLRMCHRKGFLHAEVDPASNTTVFMYPSLMHRRIAEAEWNSYRSFLTSHIHEGWGSDIMRMVAEVISNMSRTVLKNPPRKLGPAAEFRPESRAVQDEFFRAAWSVGWVKGATVMDQSLGGAPPDARLFDLWIEPQGWAITICRPGLGAAEYKACLDEFRKRFLQSRLGEEEKREYGDRNDMRAHVLLDFRTKKPTVLARLEGQPPPWLYYVVFQKDYEWCEIFDAAGKSVDEPFKLRH